MKLAFKQQIADTWTEVANFAGLPRVTNIQFLNPTAEEVEWSFDNTSNDSQVWLPAGVVALTHADREPLGKLYARCASATPTVYVNIW